MNPNETNTKTTQLTTDDLFDTLSNKRRRYVLHYMKQRADEGAVPIRTLSEQIAAWENGIDSTAVEPKQRKRIYTALHQTHLPRMDRLGIIEYDQNRGTVSMNGPFSQFDVYYNVASANDMPWSHLYLAMGSVLSAALVTGTLGIWPFSAVSGLAYAGLAAVLLVVVGGYHTLEDRKRFLGAAKTPPELSLPTETSVRPPREAAIESPASERAQPDAPAVAQTTTDPQSTDGQQASEGDTSGGRAD